ncbi:MAG: two-component sensor histidine kinase [Comamonadaceae bacterium]|nr:two-component sensor histidine kinase [Comamonadaceae bacterium]
MTSVHAWPVAAAVIRLADDAHDAQVAELRQQLEAARTELQEFTYTVSHDLRAPLRHINAFAQIIEEDLPDMPPDIAGHLATIRQSAQLLTNQLDGLTALSRLGQQVVQVEPVDADAVVHSVIETLYQQVLPRQLQWQVAADIPPVLADAGLLGQVLTQLLDNACKFTRGREPATINVSWVALPEGRCGLSVQDNGVGFRPEQAGQLFKVFARLHPAREFDGLGLGLVFCRKMMLRMGGSISIEAAEDAGCCVRLTLPLAAALTAPGAG